MHCVRINQSYWTRNVTTSTAETPSSERCSRSSAPMSTPRTCSIAYACTRVQSRGILRRVVIDGLWQRTVESRDRNVSLSNGD